MLLYGGAAGGGKTDLLLGLAYNKHHRAIIYRREYTQFSAMLDRAHEIFREGGHFSGKAFAYNFDVNDPTVVWAPGKKIEFGAVQNVGDERKFQGRPHDMKGFDEVPHLVRSQFDYLRGWLRNVVPGLLWQIVATCNPPQHVEERWINAYWGPWIDRKAYPNPEKPGKLLWFIMREGNSILVDGPGKHLFKGKKYIAMSRTFIPSSVKDNMYLDDGQYESVLESLPEPLRSQLLEGDFQAGITDDEFQLIPTDWVEQAQARWKEQARPNMFMQQIGVDASRGGKNRMVISPRYGHYFDTQIVHEGVVTDDGFKAAQLILPLLQHKTVTAIDVIGVGSSPYDVLCKFGKPVAAMNGAAGSGARDRSGHFGFSNKRAEWHWKLREALDPVLGDNLALPPDPELLADLTATKWKLTLRGIQVEPKEDIIERLGRSPDKGDSLVYASVPIVNLDTDATITGDDMASHSNDAPWNLR